MKANQVQISYEIEKLRNQLKYSEQTIKILSTELDKTLIAKRKLEKQCIELESNLISELDKTEKLWKDLRHATSFIKYEDSREQSEIEAKLKLVEEQTLADMVEDRIKSRKE